MDLKVFIHTMLYGVQVVITPEALLETTERSFPVSKHRSKRLHKKLVKRFGGEFRRKPSAFLTGGKILCHPQIYAELVAQLDAMMNGGDRRSAEIAKAPAAPDYGPSERRIVANMVADHASHAALLGEEYISQYAAISHDFLEVYGGFTTQLKDD